MTSTMQADVEAIDRLDAVKTALQVLRRASGLRISPVARVTPDSWTACAILDDVGLGLAPGDPLDATTTFAARSRRSLSPGPARTRASRTTRPGGCTGSRATSPSR